MQIKLKQSLLLFVVVLGLCAFALAAHAGPVIAPGWGTPVFEDNFDGDSINYGIWEVANWANNANNEQQYYHPDQVSVGNGTLQLQAELDPNWTYGKNYNSGLVRSWQEWSYGRFEVRAKLPYGQGFWPAIWLLPRTAAWPTGGEIDIMEARGDLPYRMSSAVHWGYDFNSRQYRSQAYESGDNFQEGYHDYAVEWDVGTVRFYVDGVNHYTLYEPDISLPSTPKSLVLNLAVGGDYSGFPNGSTPVPSNFDIDYVRVWQRSEPIPPPTSLLADPGFEDGGGSLVGWEVFGSTIDNVQSDWGTPRDGERSLKLYGQFNGEANVSGAYQSVEITGGSRVTASAHALIRSEDSIVGTDNRTEMKLEFYSQTGGEYGSDYFLGESLVTVADGDSPHDAWSYFEIDELAPLDAVEARIVFAFVQSASNSGGAVFIDSATLEETLLGDYNGDGSVDGADLTDWQIHFGTTDNPFEFADGNGDGDSDGADFLAWQRQLGNGQASTLAASGTIPEPSTGMIALALIVIAIAQSGRDTSHVE